jgi:hypothetical protein
VIDGPAMISFSGGRTSAFMLHKLLEAYGGTLPADWRVVFANTGKEKPETIDFVEECASRWGVKVNWVEWRRAESIYATVTYGTASRAGEPFKALIDSKQRLPNGHERWCTQYLKVLPMFAFMRDQLGLEPGQYTEIIGMRHDEGLRIFRGMDRAEVDGRRVAYPLAKAKTVKADVMRFWLGDNRDPKNLTHPLPQGFDLGLQPWEGNCDLCFQKGKGIRKSLIRADASVATWWADREREQNGWFDKRDRVSQLVDQVRASPTLFDEPDDFEYDVECGTSCAPIDEPERPNPVDMCPPCATGTPGTLAQSEEYGTVRRAESPQSLDN